MTRMNYSLNYAESRVCYLLNKKFKKGGSFCPYTDKGVDILLIPDYSKKKAVRIQVKASRVYPSGHGWITMSKKKIKFYKDNTDFMIIYSYELKTEKGRTKREGKLDVEEFF